MIDNLFNTTGFYWWVGVVEDRMDPLMLGRCRVRALGYHTEDKGVLPTEDLPWAMPIQSITSGAVTGFGRSATGLLESSWVFGFFADGADAQQPIILGSFAGIPQTSFYGRMAGKGFTDPNDKYPLKDHMEEPDTNRLARNQKISETIVQDKRDTRRRNVVVAFRRSPSVWDQPRIPYNAKYPFNHVHFTESGHVLEMDDTADNERLHMYHRTGTFVEIDSKGTMVRKVVGDTYEIFEANGFIYIRGKANVTVEGTVNIYAMNDLNVQVDGNATVHAHGQMEFKTGKKMIFAAADNIEFHSDKAVNIHADRNVNIKAGRTIAMGSRLKTTINSPILETGTIKMGGFSISPIPPRGPSIGSIPTISPKNPTEEIITIGESIGLRQKLEIAAQIYAAELAASVSNNPTPERQQAAILAREYIEAKQTELEEEKLLSAPSTTPENEQEEPSGTCETGNRVVQIASQDIGVLESVDAFGNGRNCGGSRSGDILPLGSGPFGSGNPGRIDEMLTTAGYNNQSYIAKGGSGNGQGFYWCAAAVTDWWKAAGLPTPPIPSGACRDWARWAESLGIYTPEPEVGAVILYGPKGSEHHMGIVSKVTETTLETIEGNTSGGGFSRNGGGCFRKVINNWLPRTTSVAKSRIAFIKIPPDKCVPVPSTPTVEQVNNDMNITQYLQKVKWQFGLPDSVWEQLPAVVDRFGINTPLRMAHFLAQTKHESQHFRRTEEGLSYRSVGAIRAAFKTPTRDKDDGFLSTLVRNAERLANFVYANRLGNGSQETGDGFRFRGRGFIQLTGRAQYQEFSALVPEDTVANPDLLKGKYAMMSAGFFWQKAGINAIADRGRTDEVVAAVTRRVNGGTNGLAERQKFFREFASLIDT